MKRAARYELIGIKAEVIDAKNKTLVGKHGKIVDETKNTVVLEDEHAARKLLKEQVKLRLKMNGSTVDVDGRMLLGRPEDRLKKRMR